MPASRARLPGWQETYTTVARARSRDHAAALPARRRAADRAAPCRSVAAPRALAAIGFGGQIGREEFACSRGRCARRSLRPRDQAGVAFDADHVLRRCAPAAARNCPVRRTDRAPCSSARSASKPDGALDHAFVELAIHLHEIGGLKLQLDVELRQPIDQRRRRRSQRRDRVVAAGLQINLHANARVRTAPDDRDPPAVSGSSMRMTSATALSATATSICGTRLRMLSVVSSADIGSAAEHRPAATTPRSAAGPR